MSTDFIFCLDIGVELSRHYASKIELIGRMNWSIIEAELIEKGYTKYDLTRAVSILSIERLDILITKRLSGLLLATNLDPKVLDNLNLNVEEDEGASFTDFRQAVWENTDRDCWLDLEIRSTGSKLPTERFISKLSAI